MTTETGIKVLMFSGDKKDWEYWSSQFMSKASIQGWDEVFDVDNEDDIPTDAVGKNGSAETKQLWKDNKRAMNELLLSMSPDVKGKVCWRLIDNTKNPDKWKYGNAKQAWNSLRKKFEPRNACSLSELTKKWELMALNSVSESPDVFISEMQAVQMQLFSHGINKSDEEC